MKILLLAILAVTVLSLKNGDESLFEKMQREEEEGHTLKVKSLESDFLVNNSTTASSLDMQGLRIENNVVHIAGETLIQLNNMRVTGEQLQALVNYYHVVLAKCGKDLEKCQPNQDSVQSQMRFQQKKAAFVQKTEKTERKEEVKDSSKSTESNEDQLDEQVDALLD